MTKFDVAIQIVEKRVPNGSAMPPSKGDGPQRPPNFWDPICAHTVWPRMTKFVMITHVGEERVSKRSAMPNRLGNVGRPTVCNFFRQKITDPSRSASEGH